MATAQGGISAQFFAHVLVFDSREVEGRRAAHILARLGCRSNWANCVTDDQNIRVSRARAHSGGSNRLAAGPDLLFVSTVHPRFAREITTHVRSREQEDAVRGFEPHHVPIVGLGDTSHDHYWCLDAGMDDFLSGPLSNEAGARVLETWTPQTLALTG